MVFFICTVIERNSYMGSVLALWDKTLLSSFYCLISNPDLDHMLIFLQAVKEYPEEGWVNILG